MSAANDLLSKYQHVIADVRLVTGSKGVFDVVVDGQVLYSKDESGRHAQPGEIVELFKDTFAAGVAEYGS